jgi:hypothetical protein
MYKGGRKTTYNVTMRPVRDIIIVVTKIITYSECVCMCVCMCRPGYQTCNAHAPYYIVICGLTGCTILFHIIS